MSRGPHETGSKVLRAELKNDEKIFFEFIPNVFEKMSSFFLMFAGHLRPACLGRCCRASLLGKVPFYVGSNVGGRVTVLVSDLEKLNLAKIGNKWRSR